MTSKTKLDKKKPFAHVRGNDKARYLQGGHYFDFHGNLCGEVDPKYAAKPKRAAKPTKEQESSDDVLARAADKLNLDAGLPGGGSVPKDLQDAAKENSAALAAEENA